MKSMKGGKNTSTERTAQDIPMNIILIGIVAMVAIIWLVPAIPVNPIGALIIVIFGFFFATVSSRMVGLVGSSNNPCIRYGYRYSSDRNNGYQRHPAIPVSTE